MQNKRSQSLLPVMKYRPNEKARRDSIIPNGTALGMDSGLFSWIKWEMQKKKNKKKTLR
jgi:hypothetical protein